VYNSQLKIINITSKSFKKELIISTSEVSTLRSFIKEIMEKDVMIINTNIGLDVYYRSLNSQKTLIVNAFLILVASKNKSIDDFFIRSLQSKTEIKAETLHFFKKIGKNPLLFKSYSKSLFNQLNANYTYNKEIVDELLDLWQKELLEAKLDKKIVNTILPGIIDLQGTHFETNNLPILRHLIEETLCDYRSN